MDIKCCTSRYLDSAACAARLSDDAYVARLFSDCLGRAPDPAAARLRRLMLQSGFPRSRMRHDMLTTAEFRRRLSHAPFWLYYDLFVREVLNEYQRTFIEKVRGFGIAGKRILEVGCSYGDITRALARGPVEKVIGIDLVLTQDFYFDQLDVPAAGDGFHAADVVRKRYELRQADIRKTGFEGGSFDLVISDATLEHVDGLDRALAEIRRLLKPGGLFFARWGPIWSAVDGHHFYHWFKNLPWYGDRPHAPLEIPPWGHLRMREDDLFAFIKEARGEELAAFACRRIYRAGFLNRLMPDDYLALLEGCPLEKLKVERLFGPAPSPEVLAALPRCRGEDLRTSGFEVLLRKPGAS